MELSYLKKTAVFSEDGRNRYQLTRIWDRNKPLILFILYNPSIADANQDDPTLRRVVRFAASWDYGGVLVGNLYPFCSSNPKQVPQLEKYDDKNIAAVEMMLTKVTTVVYAWGQDHPVPNWLTIRVADPKVLAVTKAGFPKHPLYLHASIQLQAFKP